MTRNRAPLRPAIAKRLALLSLVILVAGCDIIIPPDFDPGPTENPRVTTITPADGAQDVALDVVVSTNIELPNGDTDVLTLTGAVTLIAEDGSNVSGIPSAEQNSITFTPQAPLEPNTRYTFSVTNELRDLDDVSFEPFQSSFTTEADEDEPDPGPAPDPTRPTITDTDVISPVPGTTGARTDLIIQIEPQLVGEGVVDLTTFTCDAIYLTPSAGGSRICGNTNSNAGFTIINFQPDAALEPLTKYTFTLTDAARDTNGLAFVPYNMTFTTGEETVLGDSFSVTQVFDGASGDTVTYLAIGPDGMLYGSSLNGVLRRWQIDPVTGELSNLQTYTPQGMAGRSIIGLAFDPAEPNTLWLAHNDSAFAVPACDFTSGVAKLTLNAGASFTGTLQAYITGLPRSTGDHFSNGLSFGPDGMLYLAHGSNNSHGGTPDEAWRNREERLLTAAILEIDPRRPQSELPIHVQTDDFDSSDPSFGECQASSGSYDPYAPNAPVQLYATGLRNPYDLVWHSNGSLYAPVNGPNDGGTTPAIPGTNVGTIGNGITTVDILVNAERDGYYGHPNPARDEYVFNGGNPSGGSGPYIYSLYPTGTEPDPNWQEPAFNLGLKKSVNGIIEYTASNAFQGDLIVAQFANDPGVYSLTVESDGSVSSKEQLTNVSGFPLALVENPVNGDIYVAKLFRAPPGRSQIDLLRPTD